MKNCNGSCYNILNLAYLDGIDGWIILQISSDAVEKPILAGDFVSLKGMSSSYRYSAGLKICT